MSSSVVLKDMVSYDAMAAGLNEVAAETKLFFLLIAGHRTGSGDFLAKGRATPPALQACLHTRHGWLICVQ